MSSQHKRILSELNVESTEQALVQLYEAVGRLVLCVHWLRGTFNWLLFTGVVKFPSDEDRANYERLFSAIELYEKTLWEIAPSRAAVVGLRDLRKPDPTITVEELSKLLIQDAQGRIPFNASVEELEDLKDLLRRLGEARIARENGANWDLATKRAHLTCMQQSIGEK